MLNVTGIVVALVCYLLFGVVLALAMFAIYPLIEQGKFDRVYPTPELRERARRNAGRTLDVIELDMPGGRVATVLVMAICWPYVMFGRSA